HGLEVLPPARVDDLEDHVPLDLAHELRPEGFLPLRIRVERVTDELVDEGLAALDVDLLAELRDRDVGAVERLHLRDESGDVPLLGRLGVRELAHVRRDDLLDPAPNLVRQVVSLEHAAALVVDDHALRVHHVVVLEDVLARDEVLLLDLLLRVLDLTREDRRLHRLVVRDLEALHDSVDPIAGEQTHAIVLGGEVEAGLARVALAAGAAAQLVVDAPRLVALRPEHVQPAEVDHALAELDVDTAPGHVGRDCHRAGLAGVHDDLALALVLLRVQDVVRDPAPREQLREVLGGLDRDRADEHGLPLLVTLDDVLEHRAPLGLFRLEDEVVLVRTRDRHVRGDLDDVEVVDLDELLLLRLRRPRHAGELLVEAEVVLERDRRERDVLLADRDALLRLDRLVQALAPATPLHDAARELVDDLHLAVLHDVVDVALHHLARQGGAFEVANHAREVVVRLRRRLGLAGDDERRPRLVDEDRVDLVDDRERVAALHRSVERDGHVVAQVVESELRVRPVRD